MHLSIRDHYYSMEHVEDLQSWLVDSEHYSSIGGSQSIEVSEKLSRGSSIKTCIANKVCAIYRNQDREVELIIRVRQR